MGISANAQRIGTSSKRVILRTRLSKFTIHFYGNHGKF
jgi:hypothetical protein